MILETIDSPVPYIGVTIDGAAASGTTIRLWREWSGQRAVVRGTDGMVVLGADYVDDWEAPIGVPVTYRAEILAGPALAAADSATVTLTSASGWLSDPLDPTAGVPVSCDHDPSGRTSLTSQALSRWEWGEAGSVAHVLGDPIPVGLGPGASGPQGVPLSIFTETVEATTALHGLLSSQAGQYLIRALPHWWPLPALGYWRISRAMMPLNAFLGGTIWEWELTGTQVRPQTITVAVPLWTYADVQALWGGATYGQVQAAASGLGLQYLDVKRDPERVDP